MFGCSALAKGMTYRSIYCAGHVWSMPVWYGILSYTARDCALLDAVQNHAARWIVESHWNSETLKWTKSSKDCVSDLNWPSSF